MAVSNEDVRAYVEYVLSLDMSDADKAATINAAAEAYGVSNEQISQATGYSQEVVNAYLGAPEPPAPVYEPPPPPVYEPPPPVYYEPEPVYDYAAERAAIEAAQEAARQEAARQEAARIAEQQRIAAEQEAARQAAIRQEQERQRLAAEEAARQEAARQEAIRQEQIRQEQIRQEQIRQEQERQRLAAEEAARQEAIRQEAARVAAEQEAARQTAIRDYITGILNNPALTDYERAQQINTAAAQNNVSREEISKAINIGIEDVNSYLNQPAPTFTATDGTVFSSENDRNVYQKNIEAAAEAQRIALEQQIEQQRIATAQREQETKERDQASAVGINLPENWFQLDTQDKVDWLVGAKVTEGQLRDYGVTQTDLDALKKEYGYYDAPAKEAAEFKERSEAGIGSLYQEILGRAPTASELSQYASQFGDVISPEERATFLTGAAQELSDKAFAKKAEDFKQKIIAGNPSDDTLIERVVSESILNKWSPQETIALIDKAFNRTTTMAEYESAMQNVFQDKVANLLSNGATIADLRAIATEQGIRPDVADVIISQTANELKAEDIRNQTKGFINTTTADGKTTSTLDVGKLINWADANNLSYTDVANALKTTFPSLTTDNLVFEKDRSIFVGLIDPKTNQVDFPKAISTAIDRGIELDNLAKFYGKTEAEFKDLVQSNLGTIANSLRTQGINPEAGLNDLLGLKEADTIAALKSFDQDVSIRSSLTDKQKDGLTLNEILDEISTSGMNINDFVKRYFGEDKGDLVTSLKAEEKFTPQERQWREAASGLTNLTPQQVVDFQTAEKLSDADMDRIFGIKSTDLNTYRAQVRDAFITTGLNQLQASDNKLDYSEILSFAKENNIPFTEIAKYIATPEKQEEAVKTLQDVSTTQAFRESLVGTQVSDYQGNKYDATQLLKLADQIKQNFDLKSSSGGVYQTEGQSVGFNYDEASKLFPEGKSPKVVDQVALDMARGLMRQGITDVSEISKYKPTEVIEQFQGEGSPIDYTVTKYIDPATGKEFSPYLGATYTGEGGTNYQVKLDASGAPVFSTSFEDTSDKQEIGMMLAFAAAVFAPQILPELIGTTVGGVELAALGGEMVAGTGLTGHLMAAGVSSTIAPYAASVLVNGTVQGLMAEAGGGSFEKGFITGGVAPVIGQLATNAINTTLSDLNLPAGVDKAVGNAVTQLIAKGEIDPTQMLIAGVSPTISKTIQDATGLNTAQTNLLLNTIASEGKNLQALLNPTTAITFINQNKGIFDNIGLDAASGTTSITSGQPVDLGAFNEDQVAQLQGKETTKPDSTLSDVINTGSAVTGNGDPVFLDNSTKVSTESNSQTKTEIIPGGSITIIQGQPKITTDPVTGEAVITSEDAAYVPVLEYYKGPNGTIYTRDLRNDTITQYLPQGQGEEVLGGQLILDENSKNLGTVVSGLPPGATFYKTAYTSDITAGSTVGASLPKSGDEYILTESVDSRVNRPAYLTTTDLPDGTKQVINNITGDRVILDADGNVAQEFLGKYSKLNNFVNSLTGTAQVGIAGLGKNYAGAVQQAALKFDIDAPGVQKLIDFFQDVETRGGVMRPEFVNQSREKFIQDAYKDIQAAADKSETGQPSMADQYEAIKNAIKNNPVGAFTLFGEELVQNPEILLLGPARLVGAFILNVAESSGAQALQKANELKQADIRAGNTLKTDKEYAKLAASDAGIAAVVTGAISMIPGLGGPVAKTIKEMTSEYLEEFTIAKMTGKSDAEAATNGAVGAWLGGKVAATSELGNAAQQYTAGKIGVQPVPEVAIGASKVPDARLEVVGKRPSLPDGINIEPPSLPTGIVAEPVKPEDAISQIINNTGIVSTLPSDQGVTSPVVTSTEVPLKQIPLGDGASSPIVDYNQRKIVLVDVDGQQIPFYLSTGLAGKEGVPSGQWYPFFGISQQYDQNGNPIASTWINKGSEQEMASYYGSPTLAEIGKKLDESIGDIRFQDTLDGKPIPSISGQALDSPSISAINDGLTPARVVNTPQGMVVISSDAGNLDKSINAVRQIVMPTDNQKFVVDGAIQKIQNGQITTPEKLNDVLQQFVDNGTLKSDQLPAVIGAINQATNISAAVPPATGIVSTLPPSAGTPTGIGIVSTSPETKPVTQPEAQPEIIAQPGTGNQPDIVVQPEVVTQPDIQQQQQQQQQTQQQQTQQQQPQPVVQPQPEVKPEVQPVVQPQPEVKPETQPVVQPEIRPEVDQKPFIDVEPPKPVAETPTVKPGEFVFSPVDQQIINTIIGTPIYQPTPTTTPTTTPTITTPTTTPVKPVTVPKVPTIPFFPFIPIPSGQQTGETDYGQPEPMPFDAYGIFNLPPPEYTRSYGPLADVGIMSGATK